MRTFVIDLLITVAAVITLVVLFSIYFRYHSTVQGNLSHGHWTVASQSGH